MRASPQLLILPALLACGGGIDRPAHTAEISIAGIKLQAQVFYTGLDRARVPDILYPFGEEKAALVGYSRPRHIHLYGNTMATDYDVMFLDEKKRIVEITEIRVRDKVRIHPESRTSAEGVTSRKLAQFAVLLESGWIKRQNIQIGEELEFSDSLYRRGPKPMPRLEIEEQKLHLELALDADQRARGLMHRRKLLWGEGMLFVYPRPKKQSFWMRHTWIPLDVAFLRADGTILNVVETDRWGDPERGDGLHPTSVKPCRYVLEVNKGWFRKCGLLNSSGEVRPGLRVKFPKEALVSGS